MYPVSDWLHHRVGVAPWAGVVLLCDQPPLQARLCPRCHGTLGHTLPINAVVLDQGVTGNYGNHRGLLH